MGAINWNEWDNFGPWWEERHKVQNKNPISIVLGHIGSLNNYTVNISIGKMNN